MHEARELRDRLKLFWGVVPTGNSILWREMKSPRMLCNLGFLAVLFLAASLTAYAGPVQLNLNFDSRGGNASVGVTAGGPSSGDVDGLTCVNGTCIDMSVGFSTGSPISTVAYSCRGPNQVISTCYTMDYGAGGFVSISVTDYATGTIENFLGTLTGGTGQIQPNSDVGAFLDTGYSFNGNFILNGYSGQGSLDAQCGYSLACTGDLSFSGVATPEPNSLVLLLSGAGILMGLIRRKIWA